MEFHISRSFRDKLHLNDLLFSYTGNVIFGNVAASRRLAQRMNELRGVKSKPERTVNAGALFAMGLIDEMNHALIARYRKEIDPSVLSEAVRWFESQAESAKVESLLLAFTEQFPNMATYRGELSAAEWLKGESEGLPNREAALEELLLLWLSNNNPAFAPYRELFEDSSLRRETIYQSVTATLPDYFSTRPPIAPEVGSLLDALRAPFLMSPNSLTGQLDFIRENWSKYLGQDMRRVLLAIDVLREEDLAVWMRFHPPSPDQHRHGAAGWGGEGFVGDEFVGFDDEFTQDYVVGPDGTRHRRYAAGYQAPLNEYEAFSADQAWMPNVVLMAKSTYVWLEQLSKKYGRHIHRLDHIPDEELRLLADRGITGLWLIGLWERSSASQTIKRLRGHADAVASAYSLKGYEIAEDLGGRSGYDVLRSRAGAAGIRLASDMVPNHMGIDSDWVIEHPDWFISRWESPFPVYRFEGPDLSTDSRVEIKIEDHYYEQTDAAVVFRLRHHRDGTTRYVYHGNDGTTFAWNDTAQLDYSKAMVREHVIQTILHVARMFPIIRFDAAMVLAKRHVQRLWFPLPGAGGSIPSRAENAMSDDEFNALMPHEFWREVVDRVAAEVPGTLLLAEAFWLLEGYFVRTLGMHRVYNSAFMNMLRDEENAKYRSYLKKTIEFDPDILKRYVNFMSNPDERTAIDQFGDGDKFFGVCTLLATLPGLPMFAHGQIEGYTERYGMEFKQAKMDESPNDRLTARHQHEIAPLLHNRQLFAESANFVLYDFWTEHGAVDENVFAYSNRLNEQIAIVVYNNSYDSTRGTIHISVASMDKGSGQLRQRSLVDGLGVQGEDSLVVAYRDTVRNLEYLRRVSDLRDRGMNLDLHGYQYVVLLNWRELHSTVEQPWDRLCDALHGVGVPSVDEALSKLRLRPLHEALRQAVRPSNIEVFLSIASARKTTKTGGAGVLGKVSIEGGGKEETALDPRLSAFVESSRSFFDEVIKVSPPEYLKRIEDLASLSDTTVKLEDDTVAKTTAEIGAESRHAYGRRVEAMISAVMKIGSLDERLVSKPGMRIEQSWTVVLAWILLRELPSENDCGTLFDDLQLRSNLAEIFSSVGMAREGKWRAAALVRILVSKMEKTIEKSVHEKTFWADADVRWLTGINEASGKTYFNREAFDELVRWIQLPALVRVALQGSGVKQFAGMEDDLARESLAAKTAGFELDAYLNLWSAKEDEKDKMATSVWAVAGNVPMPSKTVKSRKSPEPVKSPKPSNSLEAQKLPKLTKTTKSSESDKSLEPAKLPKSTKSPRPTKPSKG
jgi:hypothetical protein